MALRTLSVLVFIGLAFSAMACKSGKDLTDYAKAIVKISRPPLQQAVQLPRRLIGDVFLNRGGINGLEGLNLVEDPVTVVCFNETLGAIQIKLKAENMTAVYDWVYGENESWGTARLAPQDLYLDLDIEKSRDVIPSLIAFYVSEPVDYLFNVTILGGKHHSNAEQYKEHIQSITKVAFSSDARLALTYNVGPRIEDYLSYSDFTID